jgi:hypothetical protein
VFGEAVFQYTEVTVGTHELRLVWAPRAKPGWLDPKELPPPLAVDCQDSESVFIEVKHKWGYSLELQPDGDTGREQVLKRELVVPGYARRTSSS